MPRKVDSDSPKRAEAVRLFHVIGARRMRRVMLLARQGHVDHDPDVAASALEWARLVLSTEPVHPELDSSAPRRIRAILVGTFWLADDYSEWLRDRTRRRGAMQIVRAAEGGTEGTARSARS